MLKVFVPKESAEGETRVAVTPAAVKTLGKRNLEVRVEVGAGASAHFLDGAYQEVGATLVPGGDVGAAWSEADIILTVAAPTAEQASAIREGAVLLGFLDPYRNGDLVRTLRDGKVSVFPMELVPRISRAQSMDALSSQASIAGYKAALLAASNLDKYFPLLMTAAGTIKPARAVIMGAGVAGLQAIATCKRLGAIVEVSDIRPAVKEEVESLGGAFIELPMKESGEGEGGYAREVTRDFLQKQQAIVAEHVKQADVVITTALVPGRPAPKLVTEQMVKDMREGGVIVDLAVAQGGNCALSEKDQTVVRHGVTIIGPSNLPATLPLDASMVYARNLTALLQLMVDKEGALSIDVEDEVIDGALLTHEGKLRNQRVADAIGEKVDGASDAKAGDDAAGDASADDKESNE